jgi:YcaO-like protein with predicted kinase domain
LILEDIAPVSLAIDKSYRIIERVWQSDSSISQFCRASSSAEAYAKVMSWARLCGVTRLAEATGLDRVGIPNYYVVRPKALHPCAIVSSGKGPTRATAMLSGLFECYERWAAEEPSSRPILASAEQLHDQWPALKVVLPQLNSARDRLLWIVAIDLISQEPCFVPARSIVFPYKDVPDLGGAVPSDTNGLASGTTLAEAVCMALLELIERDAIARMQYSNCERLDVHSLPQASFSLVERFLMRGIDMSILLAPSPTKLPVFLCVSLDEVLRLPTLCCSGSAANPDGDEAITRAVSEVAQSRISFITTVQEDVSEQISPLLEVGYEERRSRLQAWFHADTVDYRTIPNTSFATFSDLLSYLVARVREAFPDSVLACAELQNFPGLATVRLYNPSMLGIQ